MSVRLRRAGATILAAALGAAAIVAAPAAGGEGEGAAIAKKKKAKPKIVTVADDYFSPGSVKLKKGKSIRWVWSEFNFNPHNVRLGDHPKKVKASQFKSPATGAVGLKFQKTFNVTGNYDFFCSLHASIMRMSVKVTK